MFTQTKTELYKLSKRLRSYLGFGWMVVITTIIAYGFKSGPGPADMLEGAVPGDFTMVGSITNAEFLAYFLMRGALLTFVPLFVCLVAGDLIAGETTDGTLRPLLARPITRVRVLVAKFIVAALYSFTLTMFLGAAALAVGWIFFGHGDLFVVENGIAIFPRNEALLRLGAAYALSALGMLTVGTLAFFLSTMVANSLAALGGAMMTMYAFVIVGTIPYFQSASHYFFTTHMEAVRRELFNVPIVWHEVAVSSAYLGAYIVAFFLAAMLVFIRKDVLA